MCSELKKKKNLHKFFSGFISMSKVHVDKCFKKYWHIWRCKQRKDKSNMDLIVIIYNVKM